MKPTRHVSRTLPVLLAVAVLLGILTTSLADAYDDKDFSLRFPAAMTRFATYGDVAGVGGASAGSKWSSSINPASTAWLEVTRKICISPQYTRLWFDNGTVLDVPAESVTVDAGKAGTFTGAAAQIKSNERDMYDGSGLGFYFAGDLSQLIWAKKLAEDWAVGLAFTYTKSVLRYTYGGLEVVKATSDSYGIRAGTLHKIVEKWLAGLVIDYGWSRDRAVIYGLGQGPNIYLEDRTRQFLVRPGVSFEYMKNGTVYFDYQFGTFWNDIDTLNVHRLFAGIEHGFTDWIFVRAGTCFDPGEHAAAWTCGIGFYPASWFSLDVGYQYDMFPELTNEFGRSHALNASVSFTF